MLRCVSQAGEFIHVIGDAHVYLTHIDPLKEQLTRCVPAHLSVVRCVHLIGVVCVRVRRPPRPFPRLHIDPAVTDIEAFR